MKEIKILHIADVHLGRKYTFLSPDMADVRRSEALITFENAIRQFGDAKIVLISGDLFDAQCPDNIINFVNSVFKKNPDKKFFLSCGNHDCYGSAGIKRLLEDIADNVIVFDDTIKSYNVFEDVCVYGVSFASDNSYVSLLRNFKAESNKINIMTMHADVGKNSSYNPITLEEIKESNLDYLALGHVHEYSGILKQSNSYYAYPGVLEPGGFDEAHDCGVIYGTVSKDCCDLNFYPVSKRKYIKIDFDITGFSSDEQVIVALTDKMENDNLYSINLVGRKSSFNPNIKLYEKMLNAFYVQINDLTVDDDSILNYTNEISLRGKTAKYLASYEKAQDKEVYDMACDIITDLMCRGR